MTTIEQVLPFIYGTVSIFLIILLWIGYMVFRLKRRVFKELNDENKPTIQPEFQQYQRQFPQNPQYQ